MYRSGLAQKFEDRPEQAFRVDVHPGEATDLSDQDRKRDADEESRQDGTRQEGCKNAEPNHPRDQAKQTDAKRKDWSTASPAGALAVTATKVAASTVIVAASGPTMS